MVKRLKRFLRPPTALAEQQALSWLTKLTGGELSQQQEAEFAVWLSLHSSHQTLFDELIDIWELTGELSEAALQRIASAQDHSLPTETQLTSNHPAPTPTPHNPFKLRQGWRLGFGIPVALSGLVAIALIWSSLNGGPRVELHETSTGGYAKVALTDGSTLHLNTDTRVRVLYTPGARKLQLLAGELYIEVAKDPARPLTVQTEDFSATAIGTAFGVAATPTQRWVSVAEGEVLVSNRSKAQYLARGDSRIPEQHGLLAGEKLKIDERSSSFALVKTDVQQLATWRGGQLFYRDITLLDLITDLNRYHRSQIVVHDEEIGRVRLSAVLNSNDHAGAVAALSSSLGLVSHQISETVILLAKKS